MFKRLVWMATGATAGVGASAWAKHRVKRAVRRRLGLGAPSRGRRPAATRRREETTGPAGDLLGRRPPAGRRGDEAALLHAAAGRAGELWRAARDLHDDLVDAGREGREAMRRREAELQARAGIGRMGKVIDVRGTEVLPGGNLARPWTQTPSGALSQSSSSNTTTSRSRRRG